jgi:hypothetical protein
METDGNEKQAKNQNCAAFWSFLAKQQKLIFGKLKANISVLGGTKLNNFKF